MRTYSRALIAGGMGTEKKDPIRSPTIGKMKRIELTIASIEANLGFQKRKTIDAKYNMSPIKMIGIAT